MLLIVASGKCPPIRFPRRLRPRAFSAQDLVGKKLRLIVLPDEPAQPAAPNEKAAAALRTIAQRQKDRPFTDGSDTQRLLREARAGAMYGFEPTE